MALKMPILELKWQLSNNNTQINMYRSQKHLYNRQHQLIKVFQWCGDLNQAFDADKTMVFIGDKQVGQV